MTALTNRTSGSSQSVRRQVPPERENFGSLIKNLRSHLGAPKNAPAFTRAYIGLQLNDQPVLAIPCFFLRFRQIFKY